jgi:hypothetical protein
MTINKALPGDTPDYHKKIGDYYKKTTTTSSSIKSKIMLSS